MEEVARRYRRVRMEWIRKLLQEQGVALSDEQFEAVKKAAPEHIIPKAQYNSKAEELENLKAQLTQRDTDISVLEKSSGENDELKKQISELQAKYKAEAEAAATELASSKLNSAVELSLVTAGARNIKATKALLDMEKIKLDGEQLLGMNEQLEALRKEQGFLFASNEVVAQQNGYAYTPKAGAGTAGAAPMTLNDAIASELSTKLGKQQ